VKKIIFSGAILGLIYLIVGCAPTGPYKDGQYSTKGCLSGGAELKGVRVDKIVVKKSAHKMYLYKDGKVIKTCRVSLGKNASKGPKIKEGDFRTPTGSYKIINKRCHPVKYRALYLNYPNAQDRARAKAMGVKPGGLITIHGQPYWNRDGRGDSYTLSHDWTNGCIAVTNKDLDYIWSHVAIGTPIILEE
jgi:murein L,D-transpeptidase YafK